MWGIGTLGGWQSSAKDVSDDGSTVVGFSYPNLGGYRAFIWTEAAGMEALGTLGVSADGTKVVGSSFTASQTRHAFIWSEAGGMGDLGLSTLGGLESSAFGVSADGRTVVGSSGPDYTRQRAVRWTVKR